MGRWVGVGGRGGGIRRDGKEVRKEGISKGEGEVYMYTQVYIPA